VVHNSGSMWMTANLTNSGGGFNGEIANQIAATPGTLKVDGNFTNGTGFTWNSLATSLIQVGGALSNTTAANFATDTGRVEYYNAGTPQTILVNIKSTTYGGLTASGGGGAGAKKTLGGNVTVVGTVNVANVSVLEVGGLEGQVIDQGTVVLERLAEAESNKNGTNDQGPQHGPKKTSCFHDFSPF
jgi:hypothetical protein